MSSWRRAASTPNRTTRPSVRMAPRLARSTRSTPAAVHPPTVAKNALSAGKAHPRPQASSHNAKKTPRSGGVMARTTPGAARASRHTGNEIAESRGIESDRGRSHAPRQMTEKCGPPALAGAPASRSSVART